MAGKPKRQGTEQAIDMTPMIDVVFQLIIFFIVTVNLDQEILKPIALAETKRSPELVDKDPRMVTITVDKRGRISVGPAVMSERQLQGAMQSVVNESGFGVPVMIRGDKDTQHTHIRKAMDACAAVGIWKIKLAGLKEAAKI